MLHNHNIPQKLTYLLFVIAEIIILVENIFPIQVRNHTKIHISFTCIFLLCHILLYLTVKTKKHCAFMLTYWGITLLYRIYVILFIFGPSFFPIIRHPTFIFFSYFFCGTIIIYLPGTLPRYASLIAGAMVASFFVLYLKKFYFIKNKYNTPFW